MEDRDPTVQLLVKVVPASSRNYVAGWLGDVLKVRVTAQPERGKANAAVEATIAKALVISITSARVIQGRTSPARSSRSAGLSKAEVYRRLSSGAT